VFTRNEEVLDYLHDLVDANKDTLGLKFVGYGTENLLPSYPAIDVTAGRAVREIHATGQFKVTFELNLWVYHADLAASHAVRTKDDLVLVTGIVQLIHQHLTADGNLIFSYVHDEDPGITARGRSGGVVTTRLGWTGEARIPFTMS
jgi:hypothetical protein